MTLRCRDLVATVEICLSGMISIGEDCYAFVLMFTVVTELIVVCIDISGIQQQYML